MSNSSKKQRIGEVDGNEIAIVATTLQVANGFTTCVIGLSHQQ